MKITFKKYGESCFDDLALCAEKLQDFLVKIDPLGLLCRMPGFRKPYSKNMIKKVKDNNGIIILAYDKNEVVGYVAGIIERKTKEDLLEVKPIKECKILDLFVFEKCRGLGLGKKLMKMAEDYFKKKSCKKANIDVFEPNTYAHNFYRKLGYSDRVIEMIKEL